MMWLNYIMYRKKLSPNYPKISTMCCFVVFFHHRVMLSKDAVEMANSEDPDQTAPSGETSV